MAKILNYGFELTVDDLSQLCELGAEYFCYTVSDSNAYIKHLLCVYFFNKDDKEVGFLTLMSTQINSYDTGPRNWGDTPVQIKAGTHPNYRYRAFDPARCRKDLLQIRGKYFYFQIAP